jgi:hypothetical protein
MEAAKENFKQMVRRMEHDVILNRIQHAMYYLDWHGRMGITVVMSRDVYRIVDAREIELCNISEDKHIEKIFNCEIKIVEGQGILVVGYDAMGGGFDA